MSLPDSLIKFRDDMAEVNSLIAKAFVQDANGADVFDDAGKDFIVSSAFLKQFIAWEAFLEDTFSKYLIGELSADGTEVAKYASPVDRAHGLKMLIGTQKYVDWANHEIVKRLSGLYFLNGEPYQTNMSSIASHLADLKTVRNAAAHLSSTTQPLLNALASRVLGTPMVATTVAGFVTRLHPGHAGKTVLQVYQEILDIAAENIAANRI